MYTLGINAVYHDSAACLVKDGEVLAAAEEERFTGIKHGKRPVPFLAYQLPFHAIHYCLHQAGITMDQVEHVAYSYDPQLFPTGQSEWDALFTLYIKHGPRFLRDDVPHHLAGLFGRQTHVQWHFIAHHIAHAASAFLPSPFMRAAVMVLDGRGESATTSYYRGSGNNLEPIQQVHMPHSLGLLYEQVTAYLGFLHSSDEYKVMALASYGQPEYLLEFRRLIHVDGGNYTIAPANLEQLFGPPRRKGEPFEQKHFDIAQSLQKVLEEVVMQLAQWLWDQTHEENLCLAGGVALNCVMNGRLREEGPFKNIWIQPAAGDAGTALGAALWVDMQQRQKSEQVSRTYQMQNAYLGPSFSDKDIESFLQWAKLPYQRLIDVAGQTAQLLTENKIIGWFEGRMEFGPRALGSRSILASPLDPTMQQRLNQIKDREDFRPVAPVVLEEEVDTWFEGAARSPFMLFVYKVRPERKSSIPAVCHVDGTARIQTVRHRQNPLYYSLLKEFQKLTGVPILVNTSFNTQGKPIVCTPRDAIECFYGSPLDCLVVGSFLLHKQKAEQYESFAPEIKSKLESLH